MRSDVNKRADASSGEVVSLEFKAKTRKVRPEGVTIERLILLI